MQHLRPYRLVLGHGVFNIGIDGLTEQAGDIVEGMALDCDVKIKTDRFPSIASTVRDAFEGDHHHGHSLDIDAVLGSQNACGSNGFMRHRHTGEAIQPQGG